MDKSRCIEIAERLLDGDIVQAVTMYIDNHERAVSRDAWRILHGGYRRVMRRSRLHRLSAWVACLPHALDEYRRRGIEEKVYYDTMSDIGIWVEDCLDTFGEVGLNELNWCRLHVNLGIFRLGRLQYQPIRYYFKHGYDDGEVSFGLGKRCVALHIPRGGKLDWAECEESFAMAREFLARYFPQYESRAVVCGSWLLHPNNSHIMSAGSNIMTFASAFAVISSREEWADSLRFLFSERQRNRFLSVYVRDGLDRAIDTLEPSSSLHRRAIEYMRAGGRLGVAEGVCRIDMIDVDR